MPAILIVDDSISSVMMTKALVNQVAPSFDTITVFSGKQAFEKNEEMKSVVAALIDYRLSQGTGHDVMKQLSHQLPYKKMMLLTAEQDENLRKQTLEMGAEFSNKPLSATDLKSWLDRVTK